MNAANLGAGFERQVICKICGSVCVGNDFRILTKKGLCGFFSGDNVGLFFFENEETATITVKKKKRYLLMLTNWFFAEIEAKNGDNVLFQQGDVTYHRAHTQNQYSASNLRNSNNQKKCDANL